MIKNFIKYNEVVKISDVDPFGEEEWEDDTSTWDAKLIGKTFYYIIYSGIVRQPSIYKVYCNTFDGRYGYYVFSLDSKRYIIHTTQKPNQIYLVDNDEVFQNLAERNSYLIPEDKYDLFIKVLDRVMDRFKELKINEIELKIENLNKEIEFWEDSTAENYLEHYRKHHKDEI